MGTFLGTFVLPLLLIAASIQDWNLICFINLLLFFAVQFTDRRGLNYFIRHQVLRFIVAFSILAMLSQIIFDVIWFSKGQEGGMMDVWWAEVIGIARIQPWGTASIFFFLVVQLLVSLVAFAEIYSSLVPLQFSSWWDFSSAVDRLGSHLKVASCLLLPAIQLFAGISRPSWICLPLFICSCVGLVNWSLTSNFHGLFQWWRPLMMYTCFSILVLYLYQLHIDLPTSAKTITDFIGLYKISLNAEWPELTSAVCLLLFFFMLSSVKHDLEDMDFVLSMQDDSFTERLVVADHYFLIGESRSGVRHTNVLLRGSIFRNFSINYFTYGFPVLLLALSLWSFSFASICAFALLAYVGYILYAFPSLFRLHKLNGLLLVFILLWAASTYVFNVAFIFLNKTIKKDVEIWETIGLWHYPIPGFFLFAQFCLGILVAMGNLVNNSVFLYLSDKDEQYSNDDNLLEDKEDKKILVVATVAWALHKISRAITLMLIFLLVTKPGIIHAVYMVFFLVYLLSHSISSKIRQALIFLCEAHFVVVYVLRLDLISKALDSSGQRTREILSQLGLLDHANFMDFLEIGGLLCFCAVQNHGSKMLFSFSAIIQHTPSPPFGFSILKAGLNRSVLQSVYSSVHGNPERSADSSHEHSVSSYLTHVEKKCLSLYRSCGTYVAFLTILLTVYLVTPNYISFGYLFFLLFWIIGRQLVERTKRRLWLPLKVYAFLVFIFAYCLSMFSTFQAWLSDKVNLYPDFGFNPGASILQNIWESLAILTVMQLYSYERRKNKQCIKSDAFTSEDGWFGLLRRLLIWHSEKILSIAVFYAALCPISAFGFLYLLGLVLCSILPKASRLPSKLFLGYTGLLVMLEYLFQLWGKLAHMLPGQKLYGLSILLGFESFGSGFWGLESGLRGKVLVIIACTLQYNVFHWLDMLPTSLINMGKWEDPCHLFVTSEQIESAGTPESNTSNSSYPPIKRRGASTNSWPSFFSSTQQTADTSLPEAESSGNDSRKFSFAYIWGSSKESHKWNKKRIASLRKERFEMQKTTLKVYLKFWIENISNLFGLEINMIALLLASFAILNAISIFYVMCLLTCILLKRDFLRKLWPVYFFCFASVLVVEYLSMWKDLIGGSHETIGVNIRCHDCWSISDLYFDYCQKCWLGIKIDDQRMLVSYYLVFIVSSFKLRSDHLTKFSKSVTYLQMKSQQKNASVWRDLSFDTKGMWTILDYMRLYSYCHLLDIVLALILVTGTLEYDILHLGYLGFALVFFRMRPEILKKKNKVFRYLRIYNFALIVLSLAYQSPYLGDYNTGTCEKIDYLYEVIGFYKYDYGFRITSRSALVEIVIYLLVSIQSYIFCSREFDYVSRYLEAEQIGAIVREQEKKSAWKTAQLQHIRKSEEQKHQRNLQVEKMKAEMLNLQFQLDNITTTSKVDIIASEDGLRRRKHTSMSVEKMRLLQDPGPLPGEQAQDSAVELLHSDCNVHNVHQSQSSSGASVEIHDSPVSTKSENSFAVETLKQTLLSVSEIIEAEGRERTNNKIQKPAKEKVKGKENPLLSAVQFIGDGVSQVQSLGNQAVTNIVSFLNIEPDESDSNGYVSAEDGLYDEIESQSNTAYAHLERASSVQSATGMESVSASLQIGRIFRFVWAQMRSNNDVVCYCCFVLVFLWDFSLLSMVYLAGLFLYALCVNSGPNYFFWVIMLIYSEINILLQYLYQIIIQHCGLNAHIDILKKFGFPPHKITTSFVVSTLPLFLVYIFTLLQRSITAKDGEWASLTEGVFKRSFLSQEETSLDVSWRERIIHLLSPILNLLKMIARSFFRYWTSLTQGSEAPPYLVQLSMRVDEWPLDGIQPERVESALNQLLVAAHEERCDKVYRACHSASRIRVQSIERSQESADVAITVFEVVYSSPLTGCPVEEWYRSLSPAADVANEIEIAKSSGLVEELGFPYLIISVIGGGKREVDLYAYIFCADLAVFFLVAMFYQAVIKNNSQFLDVYQLEDQFPKEFVFVLMVLFFLIVLDRVIYLCSFATGKLVFYLFNLVLFTYSVTEYAWYLQPSHQHAGALALRAIYLTKAMSLALQALQIRYGIPHKSTLYRQFLTSKVSQINYLGFRFYRALPFLYELRCVLDWSCTSTSLTMYDWLKLEDINASLFLVKCDADLNRAGHRQGQRQTKVTKFCSGICLFLILICVIWAPMLIYSSGNPTNIANPILDVTVRIDIKTDGGRLTVYQSSMCEKLPWEDIDSHAYLDPLQYLDPYNEKDIQMICCQADASTSWLVPDIVLTRFIRSLDQNMQIIFSWIFTRDRPKGKEVVKYESTLQSLNIEKINEVKLALNGTTRRFVMEGIYHRFFRVTGSGDVRYLETDNTVDIDAVLNQGIPPWWASHDLMPLHVDGCAGLTGPMAVVVSEETPQGIIGETLSKFNIWSLYLTFVLAVGRFIRLQCSDLRMRIPYENLPFCDRLIAICEDIYAARAEGELEVEEVLYWTLVKIYRSPHMLLEYTKSD